MFPERPRPMPRRLVRTLMIALSALTCATSLRAATDVPAGLRLDGAPLAAHVRSLGTKFDASWDSLFVAELRATLSRTPDTTELRLAELRVAEAESLVFGTTNARAALVLRAGWATSASTQRVRANQNEREAARLAREAPDSSDALFALAIEGCEVVGDARRAALLAGQRGAAALGRRDLAAAESLFVLAIEARRKLGDEKLLGNSHGDLGATLLARKQYARARAHLEASRTIREHTGQSAQLGVVLGRIGSLLSETGKPDSAARYFESGVALACSQGDSARTRELLVNQLRALRLAGENAYAELVGERALAALAPPVETPEQARMRGQALEELAILKRDGGRFAEAFADYEAALAVYRALEDERFVCEALGNLGGLLTSDLGEPRRALALLREAERIAKALEDPEQLARLYLNESLAHEELGDLANARRLSALGWDAAALTGDSSIVYAAAMRAGDVSLARGNLKLAEAQYSRAIRACDGFASRREAVDGRTNRSVVWIKQGRLEEAAREQAALADSARALDNAALESFCAINLADIAERRGDRDAAREWTRRGLDIVERLRDGQGHDRVAVGFFSTRMDEYEWMIHLLTRDARRPSSRPRLEEAFQWSERSKARALTERALRAAGLERDASLAALTSRLDADEALIEFSVGDSSSSAWIIRRSGWRHYALPPRGRLAHRIRAYRDRLQDPTRSSSPATLREGRDLGRLLLSPAGPALSGVRRLIIVPDDALCLLPFEALALEGEGARAPRWLVESMSVRYLPSAAFLLRPAGQSPRSASILSVVDPAYPTTPDRLGRVWAKLPGSRTEERLLGTLVGARANVRLSGAGASRKAVLSSAALADASLIHFGTHATSSSVEPELSGLWLAPDQPGGPASRLSATELERLQLRADLVTLAACESGLGRLTRGEGLVGLARACLAGGARGCLVSLWPVGDASTSRLMRDFYDAALRSGRDRDEALAAAQRGMIRTSGMSAPHQWAAFVLIGDATPLARPGTATPPNRD